MTCLCPCTWDPALPWETVSVPAPAAGSACLGSVHCPSCWPARSVAVLAVAPSMTCSCPGGLCVSLPTYGDRDRLERTQQPRWPGRTLLSAQLLQGQRGALWVLGGLGTPFILDQRHSQYWVPSADASTQAHFFQPHLVTGCGPCRWLCRPLLGCVVPVAGCVVPITGCIVPVAGLCCPGRWLWSLSLGCVVPVTGYSPCRWAVSSPSLAVVPVAGLSSPRPCHWVLLSFWPWAFRVGTALPHWS